GGYYAGVFNSVADIQSLSLQRDTLQENLADAEQTISSMSQRVSILEKGGEVDRKATEGIRQTVIELKSQIATLEEEVSFYKGIMAPGGNDKGLRVSKIDIIPEEAANRFRYSIMLTQVSDNSSYISGLAAVNIVGLQDGERVILPLRDLDSEVTELGVKFRFRYFQEFGGTLTLPSKFVPEQVQVVSQSTGSKAQRVEQTVNWPQ
ncbi:MAG TPA: DUF6776 family protein, partial [Pseudomonadales bacterium]|nr:DUF6776 family protein [Pseudomonadales bacterium]